LRAEGYRILGWGARFEGFTTLIATKVATRPAPSLPGRVQRVTLESTPSLSILAAYGVSSDPFRRGTAAKIADKREWLHQFAEQVRQEVVETENLLIIGDLNFVDDRSLPQYRAIYDFEKQAYSDMLSAGLTDLLAGSDGFTWTSHRGQGFRYDHAFSSQSLRPHVVSTLLEHQWRIGGERVTDHSAIRVETSLTFTPHHGELAVSDKNPKLS
jgi:exonuclease III